MGRPLEIKEAVYAYTPIGARPGPVRASMIRFDRKKF
jgi:hypothetical protein